MEVRAQFNEVEKLLAQAIGLLDGKDTKECRKTLDVARLKLHEAIENMKIRAAYE